MPEEFNNFSPRAIQNVHLAFALARTFATEVTSYFMPRENNSFSSRAIQKEQEVFELSGHDSLQASSSHKSCPRLDIPCRNRFSIPLETRLSVCVELIAMLLWQ